MRTVINQTDDLIESIKKSKEYIQYQKLLKEVQKDNHLYEQINEFRRRNFIIQVEKSSNVLEEIDKLQKEYKDLLNNLLIKEFFSAEQVICKMIRQVHNTILESLEIDICFLE